jgi:hypothetical protein
MNCLDTFIESIREIDETIKHNRNEKTIFKVSRDGHIARDRMPDFLKTDVERALLSTPPERNIIDSALLVVAWGAFESFMRELFVYAANQINNNVKMPLTNEVLIAQHIIYSCDAIKGAATGEKKYKHQDYTMATESLHGMINKLPHAKLYAPAYSIINFKFESGKLLQSFGRLNIQIKWDDIGNCRAIKEHFEEDKKSAAGRKAKLEFDNIYEMRCNFAHNGGLSIAPSENQNIEQGVNFLSHLATALLEAIDTEVVKIAAAS